ncbi:MAG: putative membrane protein [Myxococcota bacterium]|jgi:uncharacterized membrane protein
MNSSLVFINAPQAWVIVLLIFPALLGLSLLPYWKAIKNYSPERPRRWAITCAALRMLCLVLVCALLMQPRINQRSTISEPAPLAVVIDGSTSMSHNDTSAGSRSQWAANFMASEVLDTLESRYSVKYYQAGDTLSLSQRDAEVGAPSSVSAIGESLLKLEAEYRGRRLPDILLISDGRSNDGRSLAQAASVLAQKRMRISSIGVGTDNSVPDLVLEQLQSAQQVLSGDVALFTLRLKAHSATQIAAADIELRDQQGNLLDTRIVQQPNAEGVQLVLSATFTQAGNYSLTAKVKPAIGEVNLSNNVIRFNLEVLNTKVRVLYVEGKPRWEYRFLKERLIRATNDIEVQCWLTEADRQFEQEHSTALPSLESIPTDVETLLDNYDVIILGDVSPYKISYDPLASQDFINSVAKFVERGGGLLMLAGPQHNPLQYLETAVGKMLPVIIDPNAQPLNSAFRPQPADLQHPHPASLLNANLQENTALWQNATPLWWMFPSQKLKNGAQAWLVDAERENEFGPLVIAASHNVPSGRVAFFGTDETWRWRFPAGEKYVQSFWRASLRYLASARLHNNRGRIRLESERSIVELNDNVIIEARILDSGYQPIIYDDGIPLFNSAGEQVLSLRLNASADEVSYRATYHADQLGDLKLYITENSEAQSAVSARLNLRVVLTSKEMADLTLNSAALQNLATSTSGKYYTTDNAEEALLDLQGAQPIVKIVDEQFSFVKPWWIFALFFSAIVAEWLLRKRNNKC